ncbi:MAG TPA: methylmalonyl-CoA epimerase [Acidobacteriota bacterium]
MKIIGLDHIAVAVKDLESSLAFWQRLFGLKASPIEVLAERGVRVVRLEPDRGAALELVSPLREDSPVSNFLREKGEGIHHFCLEVRDLEAAMDELRATGADFLQEKPQPGAEGSLIAFLHPRCCGGVLVELREVKKKEAVRPNGSGR